VLELPGGGVRCFEAGDGPAILFVHGILANANLWRKVVGELSARFRCVTLDLPLGSHALPMEDSADLEPAGLADLVADAVAALGLRDVTLAGNDTGGALCQIAVARQPDRFARLFLTSCDYRENFPGPALVPLVDAVREERFAALLAPLRDRAVRMAPRAFGAVLKRPAEDEAFDSYALPALESPAVRHDLGRVLLGLRPEILQDATDRLRDWGRPVLVAWSREDRAFPPTDGEALVAEIPGARLEWIDDSYAFSPEDRPDRVADLLAGFVTVEAPAS
jgi:pimeloyl-ACP methyl ester carboxylesterase